VYIGHRQASRVRNRNYCASTACLFCFFCVFCKIMSLSSEAAALLTLLIEADELPPSPAEDSGQQRRTWVKDWRVPKELGIYDQLISEVRTQDPQEFRRLMRLSVQDFQYVLEKIKPQIERQDTKFRKAIPADVRLAITLRYLSKGAYSSAGLIS